MNKNEIKVGSHYRMKVSGNVVTVRVDSIREVEGFGRSRGRTIYGCTNLTTGKSCKAESAMKFRSAVTVKIDPAGKPHTQNSNGDFRPIGYPDPKPGYKVGGELPEAEHRPDPAMSTSSMSDSLPSTMGSPSANGNGTQLESNLVSELAPTPIPVAASSAEATEQAKPTKLSFNGSTAHRNRPGFLSRLSEKPVEDLAPHLIVEARAGCLAADTLLNINRAGKGSQMTIEKVVKQFSGCQVICTRSDGHTSTMRPWDLSIPTSVARAVSGVIKLGILKNAWFSGEKETFTVTTDSGRQVRATAIHPFMVGTNEWKTLQELTPGDTVFVNVGRSTKGKGPKQQYACVGTKYHPQQISNGDGRFKVATHRAVVEAGINNLTLAAFVLLLRNNSVASSKLRYFSPDEIVHHINEDPMDNRRENLEVLDGQKAHAAEHSWGDNVLWQVGIESVVSIESYGVEPTYDIEVEDDPHNFLANGFVVHNTGKTTTLIEGLRSVVGGESSKLTPSPQQAEVWRQMALSSGVAKTVGFCAFNKSIATELQNRVPQGVEAMTMHSLGFKAVRQAFGRVEVTQWRVADIVARLLGRSPQDIRRDAKLLAVSKAADSLVSLCKMNLTDPTEENLDALSRHYEIEVTDRAKVFSLVPQVLDACLDPKADGRIDYDDMIWLPVALNLPTNQYDLLLIDECQDLNKCQQELAFRSGKRLIFVGDDRQAIYGFAGADAQSMVNLKERLSKTERGLVAVPLTVTRRCGRAIVEEARKLVPDFEAHETCCDGKVSEARYPSKVNGIELEWEKTYCAQVEIGDMLLCRVNAPLVSQCFRFLKRGIKANIQGRDIGAGLISTINKLKATGVVDLVAKVSDWMHAEVSKEQAERNPSEARVIALQDRHDCLICFTEGAATVEDVTKKIESVFTDEKHGIGVKLSSIHKAKGLEARRVFLLMPKGGECPHPMAKSAWQRGQEYNLLYVATTRAIEELTYVR